MKRWLRWISVATGTIVLGLVLLGQHYVLCSAKLDQAIKTEVPVGTPTSAGLTRAALEEL
jgi:glycosyltransferase A (GT-A) superfamily protein (DUF2064 family)